MAKLTAAQIAQREQRAARMAENVSDVSTPTDPAVEATPMALWLDQGDTIELGGKTYQVLEFPLHKMDEGYRLIYQTPVIFIAIALAAHDSDKADISHITVAYNSLMQRSIDDPDNPPFAEDDVLTILKVVPELLKDKEVVDRMLDAVCFVLKRKHPNITPEEIYTCDDFDRTWYIRFLQLVFRANIGMRDSF
jgi:hypothetical protein